MECNHAVLPEESMEKLSCGLIGACPVLYELFQYDAWVLRQYDPNRDLRVECVSFLSDSDQA